MKILCLLGLGCCVLGGVACSDGSTPAGGVGGAGQAGMSSASGAAGGASQAGGVSGGASQAGAGGATGGASQAGAGGASGASDYCNKYCQCHEANCASTAIPGGGSCLDFCAAFPNDPQLRDCRLNMCTLVPAQPNNDHCTHSVGINECLAP